MQKTGWYVIVLHPHWWQKVKFFVELRAAFELDMEPPNLAWETSCSYWSWSVLGSTLWSAVDRKKNRNQNHHQCPICRPDTMVPASGIQSPTARPNLFFWGTILQILRGGKVWATRGAGNFHRNSAGFPNFLTMVDSTGSCSSPFHYFIWTPRIWATSLGGFGPNFSTNLNLDLCESVNAFWISPLINDIEWHWITIDSFEVRT